MTAHASFDRFRAVIGALAPVATYYLPLIGVTSTIDVANIRVTFDQSATPEQITAANAAIVAFDWSDAGEQAYLDSLDPNRVAIVQAATQAIADNQTFLGLGSPTNSQGVAQVQALTQQMNKVIKRLIEIS